MLKFETGRDTLGKLVQQTSAAGDELAASVRKLSIAAEPIAKDFQGDGRVAFENFHRDVDGIANELSAALSSVLTGISGQNTAILEGAQQISDDTRAAHSGSSFDSARFGSAR